MNNVFPPKAFHEEEIDLLLGFLPCVQKIENACYISTPITTGLRHIKFTESILNLDLTKEEIKKLHMTDVFTPNCADAKLLATKLQSQVEDKSIVVNPADGAAHMNWSQGDYRVFWGKFIQKFATRVVFVDGWQYSLGCVWEFICAIHKGISVYHQDLSPLTLSEGITMIQEACELALNIPDNSFLLHALAHLLQHQEDTNA